ncbi:MAG: PhzA/PhzB family protein [Caulobacteraceae bacterium]|nr:PhzA/PhzB family protein [Caulobacteraceae bacterium]
MDSARALGERLSIGGSGSMVPDPELAHPRLEIMHQGTAWHRAGVAASADQHAAVERADRVIFPRGLELTDLRLWATDDPEDVIVEYRRTGELWDGRPYADGGLAIFEFQDGLVRRVRNFLNPAYTEAMTRGWEALVELGDLFQIPAWHSQPLAPIDWRPHPPSPKAWRHDRPGPDWGSAPYSHAQRTHRHFGPKAHRTDDPFPVSPEGYTDFQGASWFLAGRSPASALTHDPANPFTRALIALFTPPGGTEQTLQFTHFRTWAARDDVSIAFMEWTSQAVLFTGRAFRNHGATVLTFDAAGRRVAHREYCNVAYLEAVTAEADFPGLVGAAFSELPAAKTWGNASESWVPLPIEA